MGSYAFVAQYQQQPLPIGGNLFKAEWIKTEGLDPDNGGYGEIVQSWDTAIMTGSSNDYSVRITARLIRSEVHALDVWRGKVEFPALQRKAIELAGTFRPRTVLIEDKASGQQLLQALRFGNYPGVPNPIGRTPEQDKFSRAAGVSYMVESGQMFLPEEAHWLAEFRKELLAFPNCRHDDQVDAFKPGLKRLTHRFDTLFIGRAPIASGRTAAENCENREIPRFRAFPTRDWFAPDCVAHHSVRQGNRFSPPGGLRAENGAVLRAFAGHQDCSEARGFLRADNSGQKNTGFSVRENPASPRLAGLIGRSGSHAELALLFGPGEGRVAHQQCAAGQPAELGAIGDGFDDARAEP